MEKVGDIRCAQNPILGRDFGKGRYKRPYECLGCIEIEGGGSKSRSECFARGTNITKRIMLEAVGEVII